MIPVKDPLCPLVLSDWMVKPYKSLVPLRTQRNASVSFVEYVRCVFLRPYRPHQLRNVTPTNRDLGNLLYKEKRHEMLATF